MSDWGQLLKWLHEERDGCKEQALYEETSTYEKVIEYIEGLGYWLDAGDAVDEEMGT